MWAFFKLLLWGAIWFIIWPIVTMYRTIARKPRVDNCFSWAVRRWQEEETGYLVIRWCRSSRTGMKWPHFLFLDKQHCEHMKHFLPLKEDQEYKFLPDAFFEGKVVTGDNEDDQLEN
jgi:hypothetical protein